MQFGRLMVRAVTGVLHHLVVVAADGFKRSVRLITDQHYGKTGVLSG